MKSSRHYAAALMAIVRVGILYLLARPPQIPPKEAAKLAGRFDFERLPLPEIPGVPHKSGRQVHPSRQRIAAWISTLADLDAAPPSVNPCLRRPRCNRCRRAWRAASRARRFEGTQPKPVGRDACVAENRESL